MTEEDMKNERTKLLADALHQAATAPASPEGASGLIGGNYMWGLVASRLISMMEEIAREAVDRYLNPPADKKG